MLRGRFFTTPRKNPSQLLPPEDGGEDVFFLLSFFFLFFLSGTRLASRHNTNSGLIRGFDIPNNLSFVSRPASVHISVHN